MKKNKLLSALWILLPVAGLLMSLSAQAYPVDGYASTGIRRLARLALILDGALKGTSPAPGGRRSIDQIGLNLTGSTGNALMQLPLPDAKLQAAVESLFPDRHESYSLVVLDITPGRAPRLAARQAERTFSPGSVGKLAIAAGIFTELKKIFPEDTDLRRQMLRERRVQGDDWVHVDEHEVPVFDPETRSFTSRPARDGDVFSLYEWLDHMLSASANSAASVVWKELLLMRAFGREYPPSRQQEQAFFKDTAKTVLRDMAMSTVNDPLRAAGIPVENWQLGTFFTSTGKRRVPSGGKSYANPIGLMQYLVAMERGVLVDAWSSLEIKRLMYMTARRIRYASAPVLSGAAVYYKSGSLYRCKAEEGYKCRKYMGNVENVMNSVCIVEHADGTVYMVTLMSNVLYKNSAVEHQTLGTYIDRMVRSDSGKGPGKPTVQEDVSAGGTTPAGAAPEPPSLGGLSPAGPSAEGPAAEEESPDEPFTGDDPTTSKDPLEASPM